ncbi:MAG: hypothetical protein FWD55_06055 [Propionibacteriaceae bacterium]|nr:hypothetical protein [Propionibacteriaceae bacterium]
MRIEIMYPEVCCLYGDKANMMYLRQCLPNAQFIETSLTDEPTFVSSDVDLVYFGSMSEKNQELVIDLLVPYKDRLRDLIQAEQTAFLATGNALEILGQYIKREDGTKKEALGVVDSYAVRQTPNRFNSLVLGRFETMTILGYTSRFSHSYVKDSSRCMVDVEIGVGLNPDTTCEGIRQGKLFATYLLGPLLIANPDFTKYLLTQLGVQSPVLAFEEEIYRAYIVKLAEYRKPGIELE